METKILFVEDENSAHFAVREYFASMGYSVDCARNREEALERLASGQYALVIADLLLSDPSARDGGLEGLEIVERVRRDHPGTRVLVLTACGAELEREALRRGADLFLEKPQPLARVARFVEMLARNSS